MKERIVWIGPLFLIMLLGVALAGCATAEKDYALNTEELLAAAKFKMKPADTPEKLNHLKTLTQRKIIPIERDGKMYYVYADVANCKCLYTGNEKDFKRYKDLAVKQNLSENNEDVPSAWAMWGPWGDM
jgi:hypothetical protein